MGMRENLLNMLAAGQDNPLLRYTLGTDFLKDGQAGEAVVHLRRAVELDPGYSAAWKVLGKGLAATGDHPAAMAAFEQGIAVAEQRGDIQAAKEMRVFRRRSEKVLAAD